MALWRVSGPRRASSLAERFGGDDFLQGRDPRRHRFIQAEIDVRPDCGIAMDHVVAIVARRKPSALVFLKARDLAGIGLLQRRSAKRRRVERSCRRASTIPASAQISFSISVAGAFAVEAGGLRRRSRQNAKQRGPAERAHAIGHIAPKNLPACMRRSHPCKHSDIASKRSAIARGQPRRRRRTSR